MSSTHLRRLCALVPTLLAALTGPLWADATLALSDLPAMVQSGTALPVRVDVQGATPGQLLTVTAWIGTRQAFTMEKAMEAPGEAVSLSIPVQALPAAEDLWLEAQCGPARTARRKVRLIPVPALGDLGLEDKDASAPPAGKKWKSSSSSSSSSPVPCQLASLPDDTLEKVAGFAGTGHLRYLSKSLNRIAEMATRELTIQGEMDDKELLALVRKHPHVDTLTLGFTPNLSPFGTLEALAECRQLRTLVLCSNQLNFFHIKELFDRNENLVGLRLPESLGCGETGWSILGGELTDAQLALLPERMEELEFESNDVRDETIRRFSRLRKLTLSNNGTSFHGNELPASLTSLRIRECDVFTGRRLPAGLLELNLTTVPRVTDFGLLPNLRSLTILDLAGHQEAALATLLRNAPLLTRVELDRHSPDLIAALPAGLTDLWLREDQQPTSLPSRAFARFTRLELLCVHSSLTFSGLDLPLSLKSLRVKGCPDLRAEDLRPLRLTRMEVEGCDGFTFRGLPATLRELWVSGCPKVTAPLFLAALGDLPSLEHITITEAGDWRLEAAPVLAHPTLKSIDYGPLDDALPFWERPEAAWPNEEIK